jgi:uncharacterized protein (TIGR03084 family)
VNEAVADLAEENEDLDRMVAHVDAQAFDAPTPSPGWAVRDQISHLAFFDDAAIAALTEPEEFARRAEAALASEGDPMAEHLERGRSTTPEELLGWWRRSRRALAAALAAADPDSRVPWFGPPMGMLSFVSARLMETWAHGQDVADALGIERVPTDRLRHIAEIGARTRGFSYLARGLEPPDSKIRLELLLPSAALWTYGPAHGADAYVRGAAYEFCLLVTQRRHLSDTELQVDGAPAFEWLAIAQAFAGPPGQGRTPLGG